MENLKEPLKNLDVKYTRLLKEIDNCGLESVEGNLEIIDNKNYIQYYSCTRNPKTGKLKKKYIKKSEFWMLEKLAHKSYYNKLRKLLRSRLRQIKYLNKNYEENEIDMVYLNLPQRRRDLIKPIEPTYQQFLDSWYGEVYEKKKFYDTNIILTKLGERVRSKSEKMLADYFYSLKLKYKYECPLKINDQITFHPDFTFLNPYNREEIYWEHFGMMDNPKYMENALNKISIYAQNGIFINRNLIVTTETSTQSIDFKLVRLFTKEFLVRK